MKIRAAARLAGTAALAAALLAACSSGTVGTVTQASPGGPIPSGAVTGAPSPSGSSASDPLSRFTTQEVAWSACGGAFRCAKVTVPVDYANLQGPTVRLSVVELPASGQRIGALFTDPGGPGASGVDLARAAKVVFSDALRAQYDIVGWDPRGTQRSAPVQCLSDPQWDTFFAADGTPDNAAEITQFVSLDKEFTASCKTAQSPSLLGHVSTVESAKDLDILRAVLGQTKLDYFGFSWGTMLGATYADLFPTHVGRMVLDGAMDPSLGQVELAHGQAKGMELALTRFVQDCDQQDNCPLPQGTKAGMARLQSWLDGLDQQPLKTSDPKRPLTQALAYGALFNYMYAPAYGDWDSLRQGLQDAFDGDGTTLLQMLDDRLDRDKNGHYTVNEMSAFNAVTALDYPDRPTLAQVKVLADQWSKEAPISGAILAWGTLVYDSWPIKATGTPHEIHAPGSPPILVVGTTYDPATPYPWAQSLARQLSKGVLLTHVGDGHTAYGKGSTCTDQAVDRYLLTGETPPVGTVCR